MAGEFDIARACIRTALDTAQADRAMGVDAMANALFTTVLTYMLKTRSRKDLESFTKFQLEACGEEEFVITRGS
jgi:hypothetical protein